MSTKNVHQARALSVNAKKELLPETILNLVLLQVKDF